MDLGKYAGIKEIVFCFVIFQLKAFSLDFIFFGYQAMLRTIVKGDSQKVVVSVHYATMILATNNAVC